MIGFELKTLVVLGLIVLVLYNIFCGNEVDSERWGNGAPSKMTVLRYVLAMGLCLYGLYLNDNPIILF